MDPHNALSFENAFSRLEEILEKMNSGAIALEDSIRLYEEADRLIQLCNQKLTQAEQKIEILVKNREGALQLSETGTPLTEPFLASSSNLNG